MMGRASPVYPAYRASVAPPRLPAGAGASLRGASGAITIDDLPLQKYCCKENEKLVALIQSADSARDFRERAQRAEERVRCDEGDLERRRLELEGHLARLQRVEAEIERRQALVRAEEEGAQRLRQELDESRAWGRDLEQRRRELDAGEERLRRLEAALEQRERDSEECDVGGLVVTWNIGCPLWTPLLQTSSRCGSPVRLEIEIVRLVAFYHRRRAATQRL